MAELKERRINKKKKFVADGVFNAELNELLSKTLKEYGYAGCAVKASHDITHINAKITGSADKEKGNVPDKLQGELISLVQKRFGYDKGKVTITMRNVANKALSASAQAENLKAKLLSGVSVRFCAQSVITNVIKGGGAHGCEVIISGKLRQQRAKSQKYKEGFLVSTGHPRKVFVDEAVRHVFFKQGMIGVKVKIMLPWAGEARRGREGESKGTSELPQNPLPDKVIFHDIKDKNPVNDFLPGQGQGRRNEQPSE